MTLLHKIGLGLISLLITFFIGFHSGKGEKEVVEKLVEGKERIVYKDRAVDKERIVYKDGTVVEREKIREVEVDKKKEITSRTEEQKPIKSRYAALLTGSSKGDVSSHLEMRIVGPLWLGAGMRFPDKAILASIRLEL